MKEESQNRHVNGKTPKEYLIITELSRVTSKKDPDGTKYPKDAVM